MILQAFLDGLTVLSEKWPVVLVAVGMVSIGCYAVYHLYTLTTDEKNSASIFLPILIFIVSIILRLAFITKTFVPPYFDSVEHFRLVQGLVTGFESGRLWETLTSLTPGYYHLGFHFLASLLTFGLRADPMDVILILGQIILAAIPFPIFFLILHETKSTAAAFFGAVLAGFGWFMPGFAVNWGKYPAITGLLTFELVVSTAYFVFQGKKPRNRFMWYILLALGVFISTFVHTRTLVVFIISFISWLAAQCIAALSRKNQYSLLALLIAGVLIFGFFIQKEPLLKLALEPYISKELGIILIVLTLSPFAWIKFPQGTTFSILFILCVFACLFVPLNQTIAGYPNQTLLDRPFVEMLLYFPLSLLGGLGLAGVLQILNEIKIFSTYRYAKNLTAFLFIGLTGVIALENYNFYPSDCCNLVGYDDTIAIDWLDRNTSPDARILVASTTMDVSPAGPSASSVGTDAGVWIPNLTGKQIKHMSFDIDFESKDNLEQLCQKQIDYIYVGNTNQSFDSTQLQKKTDWYKALLLLPDVQLYQLRVCPPSR